jgi:short-subunit dehydrogenase
MTRNLLKENKLIIKTVYMHTEMKNETMLVTGVTSGIGREIARWLAERGARVFGTVRNAGYTVMGALEETSIDEARQLFETNFFGVLRVTNAILPTMREAGHGRIVNISSVVGFLPAPYMGIYAASKHALEGYTETLDHEVRRFGVRAMLVEPAYTKTKINGNSKSARSTLQVYAAERQRAVELLEWEVERGDDPRIVAEAVWKALTAKSPQLRYAVGKGVALSRMRRFVPAGMFDKSFRKQFQLA